LPKVVIPWRQVLRGSSAGLGRHTGSGTSNHHPNGDQDTMPTAALHQLLRAQCSNLTGGFPPNVSDATIATLP